MLLAANPAVLGIYDGKYIYLDYNLSLLQFFLICIVETGPDISVVRLNLRIASALLFLLSSSLSRKPLKGRTNHED